MKTKALLLNLVFQNDPHSWDSSDSENELRELSKSCGIEHAYSRTLLLRSPHSRQLIGSGQAESISHLIQDQKYNLCILSHDLTGTQQRNLEESLGCTTIDRTQLILDIFARRAHSNEGKIQVELAQLTYMLPRLAGKGIALSRLGGGIGTRGPGEQKLETSRRRIRQRIDFLKKNLKKIQSRQELHRKKRQEHHLPSIALVGYTNAGKSTLFNALTDSRIVEKDQLFSTLDTTVRPWVLSNHQKILLSDTVGFLHLLPHHLVQAFKSTLSEAISADVLIHVIDVSHPKCVLREKSVNLVLDDLGVSDKPCFYVLNKSDLLDSNQLDRLKHKDWPEAIFVSAKQKSGFDSLEHHIKEYLSKWREERIFKIPIGQSQWIHYIYEEGQVLERKDDADQIFIKALLPKAIGDMLEAKLKVGTSP